MNINFQGTMAVLNDTHNPFQDQRVMREVELFLYELQPDMVIYPGDLNDFYQISKFNKNPERKGKLQEDLDSTSHMFKRQRSLLPNARMIQMDGNHEDRLRKYLWGDKDAFSSLRCLSVESLFELKDSGIEHIPHEEGVLFNGNFMATHSDLARAHSSYTAKGMSDKHGGSGIHGHSHRMGSFYKRNRFGVYGWWENGCLCDLYPDWMQNPNWQQGFSVITFIKGRFWVEPIQIINGRFIYGGKVYGSGGKKREVK